MKNLKRLIKLGGDLVAESAHVIPGSKRRECMYQGHSYTDAPFQRIVPSQIVCQVVGLHVCHKIPCGLQKVADPMLGLFSHALQPHPRP